jgi:hypothetical protein
MGVKVPLTKGKRRLRVSENKGPRRKFELERKEVTGGWRRLYSEELHNLLASPNIIRVMKSISMKLVGYVQTWMR